MKLVIDIPDYDVELIKEYYEGHDIVENTYSYIYHGKPLSEVLAEIKGEIEDLEPENSFEGFYKCQSETLEIIDKYISGEGDKE